MATQVIARSESALGLEGPARATGDLRTAGLLVTSVSSAFLTVTMLAASIAPGYDFHGGAISDLGVIAATAALFNGLLIVIGVMNSAAGYLLYRAGRRVLVAAYLLAGIGAVGAGVFPLSTGTTHALFALVAFVCINLQVIGSAVALATGPMRVLGVLAGVVGLVYAVLMIIGDAGNPAVFGPIGHGGSERMIAYPAMLWLLAFGGYLLARPRPASEHGPA
jgi:hypothetical membrane protein